MLEFTNQFINKKLFNKIKNLVILIPFTADSIKISRGGPMIEQLEILMSTFQKSAMDISKSIVPVLTKVKPTDEDFDFDIFQSDLGEIMESNLRNFLIDLENQSDDHERVKITEDDIQNYLDQTN